MYRTPRRRSSGQGSGWLYTHTAPLYVSRLATSVSVNIFLPGPVVVVGRRRPPRPIATAPDTMASDILAACHRTTATPILIADATSLPPLLDWPALPPSLQALITPDMKTTTLHRCNSSATRWHALAHRSTPLRIAVLGSSPTAGCGSAEAVDHGHNTTLSTRCDYTRSWARRVRDCVQPALDSWLPAREVVFKVGFKNAVSLAFFGECASGRLLGPHTDLILLEATNVWNTDVAFLIRRLRRAAPAAHIVFVTWPARSILDLAVRSRVHASRQRVFDGALAEEADVYDATALLALMLHAWRRTHKAAPARGLASSFYAQRGKDLVHPSPKGHVLLATFVAHTIASELRAAMSQRVASPSAATVERQDEGEKGGAPLSVAGGEQCFDEADALPVQDPGGWALHDVGSAAKGVRKMGWVSRVVNQTMRIGPLPAFPRRHAPPARVPEAPAEAATRSAKEATPSSPRCSLEIVRLGYLMSGYQYADGRANGALHLSCDGGCSCAEMGGFFSAAQTPFPTLQTNASAATDPMLAGLNASITATTQFWLLNGVGGAPVARKKNGGDGGGVGGEGETAPCTVGVRHLLGANVHDGRRRARRFTTSRSPPTVKSYVLVNSLTRQSVTDDPEGISLLWRRAWMRMPVDRAVALRSFATRTVLHADLAGGQAPPRRAVHATAAAGSDAECDERRDVGWRTAPPRAAAACAAGLARGAARAYPRDQPHVALVRGRAMHPAQHEPWLDGGVGRGRRQRAHRGDGRVAGQQQ